jgi:hypothetical protein
MRPKYYNLEVAFDVFIVKPCIHNAASFGIDDRNSDPRGSLSALKLGYGLLNQLESSLVSISPRLDV